MHAGRAACDRVGGGVGLPGILEIEAAPGVRAVFTTRERGVSRGPWRGANLAVSTGDSPEDVRANRRELCEALAIEPADVSMLTQVHGATVHSLRAPLSAGRFCGDLDGWPEGDALSTSGEGLPLMVLAADCVPVLIWRQDGGAVAAAHAGWKGTIGGVLQRAAWSLGEGDLAAAIGPCVSRAAYEVSPELAARFVDRFGAGVVDGRMLDLPACAQLCLQEAGVSGAAIHRTGRCTVSEPDRFFSHRRDGAPTGRQAAIIWRTSENPR